MVRYQPKIPLLLVQEQERLRLVPESLEPPRLSLLPLPHLWSLVLVQPGSFRNQDPFQVPAFGRALQQIRSSEVEWLETQLKLVRLELVPVRVSLPVPRAIPELLVPRTLSLERRLESMLEDSPALGPSAPPALVA